MNSQDDSQDNSQDNPQDNYEDTIPDDTLYQVGMDVARLAAIADYFRSMETFL
jgi:hypothetical protein